MSVCCSGVLATHSYILCYRGGGGRGGGGQCRCTTHTQEWARVEAARFRSMLTHLCKILRKADGARTGILVCSSSHVVPGSWISEACTCTDIHADMHGFVAGYVHVICLYIYIYTHRRSDSAIKTLIIYNYYN